MLPLVAIAMLVICAPLLLRVLWFLVKAHIVMIALFLPAGLLATYGGHSDVNLYLLVTATWATVVLLALVARRRAPAAA